MTVFHILQDLNGDERFLFLNMHFLNQSCGTSPDSEESVLLQLASVPSTGSLSSRASRLSHSAMSILAATLTTKADVVS